MAFISTIAETLTLEGISFNKSHSVTKEADYYEKKIIKASTSAGGASIYTLSYNGSGADYDYDLVTYSRITNLDSTNHMYIRIATGGKFIDFDIPPLGFHIIYEHDKFANDASDPEYNGEVVDVKVQGISDPHLIEVLIMHKDS